MSTMSPDTSWEMATPLTDGRKNNRMVELSTFDNELCFSCARRHWNKTSHVTVLYSCARRHWNKTSHVTVLYRLRWKCNCSCVVYRLRNKSGSKFYKISPVPNKIRLKICFFFVDSVDFWTTCNFSWNDFCLSTTLCFCHRLRYRRTLTDKSTV